MQKIIYEPNQYLKLGVRIWPQMIKELIDHRELLFKLFQRNLAVRFKQVLLGIFWSVLIPVVGIAAFIYLNQAKLFNIGEVHAPYPLYALIGVSIWQLFAVGLNAGCQSLVSAGDMVYKINFPREIIVLSSLAEAVYDFFVKIVLIALLLIYYQFTPYWTVLLFPLALIPLLFFIIGSSFLLALFNAIFRDTAHMLSLGLNLLVFFSPVFYPTTQNNYLLLKLNIVSHLINGPRDLVLSGRMLEPKSYFVASSVSLLIFLMAWRLFHLVETKIPERI